MSPSQVASYRPYTHFAGTGYCPANFTRTWSCGANCLANPDFKPVASGGDGEFVQYWFVGYSPSLKSVFVAVHGGFAEEHSKTATTILAAVKTALERYGADHVTLVGHSLGLMASERVRTGRKQRLRDHNEGSNVSSYDSSGGSLALLDAVYLPLHLPSSIKFNAITYGLPRVGNQAFADYVDAHLSLTHINNQKDIVPILPGIRFAILEEFHHPAGEVHIQASGEWDICPGQDNESELCSAGDVSILSGSIANHDGPYDGVEISCTYLTDP
ncbi:lipase [Mycena crocata]|nr:lipase [Mycena crocata]